MLFYDHAIFAIHILSWTYLIPFLITSYSPSQWKEEEIAAVNRVALLPWFMISHPPSDWGLLVKCRQYLVASPIPIILVWPNLTINISYVCPYVMIISYILTRYMCLQSVFCAAIWDIKHTNALTGYRKTGPQEILIFHWPQDIDHARSHTMISGFVQTLQKLQGSLNVCQLLMFTLHYCFKPRLG